MSVIAVATKEARSGLLERVRALVPRRPLNPSEALHVAERQAAVLREAVGISGPSMPQALLTSLSFVTVAQRAGFPAAGLATLTRRGWVIVLKGEDPSFRQRFSLGHELKHILDDPFIDWLYPRTALHSAHERAERICDYFAACLLMPKIQLTQDWCEGRQDIHGLAVRYHVSQQAMSIRLLQLGLVDPTPRCLAGENALA
jgi:Zn-dependent peptidase ImmA (M78 family)